MTYSASGCSSAYGAVSSYVEAEDLSLPSSHKYDDAVVLRRAGPPAAPETRNFVLLGSGLLTAAGFVRRRKSA
ncbi:hypothetical protein [Granulicella sp. S190]|uniref:hypothetical protein n=1 Tax=Granulicella sp. S190 TaxID=1747226 RepID=UPI00131B2BA3|nr:hypothetical protein [Granulicella sp. S190]